MQRASFASTCRNHNVRGTRSHGVRILLLIVGLAIGSVAMPVTAKVDYTFEGNLEVELSDGQTLPVSGAQIRVKRKGGSGVGRKHAKTGHDGHFNGTWKFTRTRGPFSNKPIRFEIQARLRDDALKIRKGGWFKKNWITIARVDRKGGGNFDIGTVTLDSGKQQRLAGLWAAHQKVLHALDKESVALTKKLVVIYPNKFVFKPNADFYLFRVRLTEKRWDVADTSNSETIIHEIMHQWDVNHMKGEKNLVCVADAHHKPPHKWAASRCSGFMEGFAEALARQINHEVFGARLDPPLAMRHLRNAENKDYRGCWDGNNDESFEINTIEDAQTTDCGWENFLTFIMSENKFDRFNNVDKSCQPQTVPKWQLLQALKDEAPRKSNWVQGKTTFTWFTEILERRIDDFDEWDSRFYVRLGDPSNRISEIQDELCDGGHTVVIDGSAASGGSDYVIRGGGELQQVRGDLAGHNVTIQSNDDVDDNRAEGYVGGGKDGFRVTGLLPVISLDSPGHADVYVNGEAYYAIVIDGSAAEGGTEYRLEGGGNVTQVSGPLAGHEVTIQSNDEVSGNRADGHVGSGKDGFIVIGDKPDIDLDRPSNAAVYINGDLQ